MCVERARSRTIQTSSADQFVRGAHHHRCAREGVNGVHNALCQRKLQGTTPKFQVLPQSRKSLLDTLSTVTR